MAGVVERDGFEGRLLDEPLFLETLLEVLEELRDSGGNPEEIAEVEAQLDFFLGR